MTRYLTALACALTATASVSVFGAAPAQAAPTGCVPVDLVVGGASVCTGGSGMQRVQMWCPSHPPLQYIVERYGNWEPPGVPSVAFCSSSTWPASNVSVEVGAGG